MTKRRQKLYPFFRFTIVLTLIALFFTFIPNLEAISEGRKIRIGSLLVRNLVSFYCWGALFLPILLLTRKFNFESKKFYFRNFLIHVVLGIFFSVFHMTGSALIAWLLDPTFRERFPVFLPYLQSSFLSSFSHDLAFYALMIFGIQGHLSRVRYAEEEKTTAQLRSELVQARLQALKMQIQPHFLFNTLNSISSLVLTNPPQAHLMIAQLGDFLRLTLDYTEDQMVPLSEELRFLRSYLEIEQIRFSDRLTVSFDVEPEVLSIMVPHLVLQPIVENSIKHAVSRRRSGGLIEVRADKLANKLQIQIKDNGPDDEPKMINFKNDESLRTGLTNVQSRLKHFYGNDAGFEMSNSEKGGTTVTLVVPLNFELAASQKS
jgi:sensor histidine kinase YesM